MTLTSSRGIARVAVSVDTGPDAPALVTWAATMAEAFGAHLTGLAAARLVIPIYAPFGESLIPMQPEIAKAAQQQVEALLGDAEAVFREAAASLPAISWKSSHVTPADVFLQENARSMDVLVLGKQGRDDANNGILGVSPADVVLTAGRPVIIVPPGLNRFSAARVLIAWKDTREARRVLADALPYLGAAEEVLVTAIGKGATHDGLADVVAFLGAHGIASKAHLELNEGTSAADALFNVGRRIEATLLVAGAYGQSRLKEWAFGGLTHEILDRTPLPCLMSH